MRRDVHARPFWVSGVEERWDKLLWKDRSDSILGMELELEQDLRVLVQWLLDSVEDVCAGVERLRESPVWEYEGDLVLEMQQNSSLDVLAHWLLEFLMASWAEVDSFLWWF